MPAGLDDQADDGFFAERLAGFQPVQALDQDQAIAVVANQDRRLLAAVQHALGYVIDGRRHKRPAPCQGHIDVGDPEYLVFHRPKLIRRPALPVMVPSWRPNESAHPVRAVGPNGGWDPGAVLSLELG